jgi:hypothetical protein
MRHFTPRIIIGLLTFTIGVIAATVWMIQHRLPIRMEEISSLCLFETNENIATKRFTPNFYFLRQTFNADADEDQFKIDWYSKHLAAMNEPSLQPRAGCPEESYRFLWLRSFQAPIAVRVWQASPKRFFIISKQLSGKGGYEPGSLSNEKMRPLTEDEWNTFTQLLSQASFWKLPTEDEMIDGNDGAQWILEGVKEDNYHIVDRWSPPNSSYRACCLYLLKLSELEID